MQTIELLENIIDHPLKVTRFSTKYTRRKFFGVQLRSSFPFPSEMLQQFAEILKGPAHLKFPCIATANPGEINPEKYDTLVDFLKALCDRHVNTTKAVLKAAIIFIERHPGSLLHEFMMLHQLREMLKFSDSGTYDTEILAREHSVLQAILQIQNLLEDTKHPSGSRMLRIRQALDLIPEEEIKAKKAALLVLESYHLSQASFKSGRFDKRSHEIKNFRFILELSSISTLDGFTEKVSKVSFLQAVPQAVLQESALVRAQDPQLQVAALMGFPPGTLSQPKTLGPHWGIFFRNLETITHMADPVSLMMSVLKIFPTPEFRNCWLDVMVEYCNTIKSASVVPDNYRIIYNILLEYARLPEGAIEPISQAVAVDSEIIDSARDQEETIAIIFPNVPAESVIASAAPQSMHNHEEWIASSTRNDDDEGLKGDLVENNPVVCVTEATPTKSAEQQTSSFVDVVIDLPVVITPKRSTPEKESPQNFSPLVKEALPTATVSPMQAWLTDRAKTNESIEETNEYIREEVAGVLSSMLTAVEERTVRKTKVSGVLYTRKPREVEERMTLPVPRDLTPLQEGRGNYNADYSQASETALALGHNDGAVDLADRLIGETLSAEVEVEGVEVGKVIDIPPLDVKSSVESLRELRYEDVSDQPALTVAAQEASLASLAYTGTDSDEEENDDDDNDNASTDAGGRAFSMNGSVISCMSEGFTYENEFLPTQSEFANKFIALIKQYCPSSSAAVNQKEVLNELITSTLKWYKDARKLGVLVVAVDELPAFKKLQKSKTLEDAYEHLYAILQVMVFAKRLRKADTTLIRPFFQDASATLIQLSQLAAEGKFSVHTRMMRQKDSHERSWLIRLTHLDETQLAIYDRHYLTDRREGADKTAETKLEKLPYVWTELYVKRASETDEKILTGRRQIEARCANLLAGILNKKSETLTIEEQALVMRVLSNYEDKNTTTPFYNALRLLAISYHDTATGVALLGSDLAKEKESVVCQALYARLSQCLFNYDDTQLTHQQRILDKRLWASIEKIEPRMGFVGGDFEDDTKSEISLGSRLSGKSGYSYRSSSSWKSAVSSASSMNIRRPEEKIAMAYVEFQTVWNALYTLKRPLKGREVKFILKNYEDVCQKTDIDAVQSNELLYRAFEYLDMLAERTKKGIFGGLSKEGQKAFEDYNGLTGYISVKQEGSLPLAFARYCSYQAGRQKTKEKMQACESAFVEKNCEYILSYREQLNRVEAEVPRETFFSVSSSARPLIKLGDSAQSFLVNFDQTKKAVFARK